MALLWGGSLRGTLAPGSVSDDSERPEIRSIDRFPLRHADGRPIVSARTIRAAIAIAEAVFSRAGAPPAAERMDFLARDLEDYMARSGARTRNVLTLMVWLVAWLAPLFVGRLSTVSSLPLPERVRALVRLEERFGEPLLAVKAMLCLLYYENPDAAREVGFDGLCLVPSSRLARGERAP
ncbi:MAG TPA: hypothetical protein VHE30_07560 [Polyangiaceae bacterium]|nr:hypothetical protein [Polyangiaceae bacterium]